MLSTLGSYVAIALENARLFEEAKENERRMRGELDTARRDSAPTPSYGRGAKCRASIWQPGMFPHASWAETSTTFLPYGQGRLGFMLGDVSGKGTAAALYGSWRSAPFEKSSSITRASRACMLALLNQRLLGARLDSRFIAMLFAVYDASTRKLTLANAGGPYPLLVRKGQVQAICLEGVPLGLIPDTQYDETTIDLPAGRRRCFRF